MEKVIEKIETYTGIQFIDLVKFNKRIKTLLSQKNKNLIPYTAQNMLDNNFGHFYKEAKDYYEKDLNYLTEKIISRQVIISEIKPINTNYAIDSLLDEINTFNKLFKMVFNYELFFCLEIANECSDEFNEVQAQVFLFYKELANMYLSITEKYINSINREMNKENVDRWLEQEKELIK